MAQKKSKKRKLTPKQEHFCQCYVIYWNATRAAREAGYSDLSAGKLGFDLLNIPLIQDRVEQLKKHALKELGVSPERILLELTRIATVDIGQAFDDMGQLKPLKEIPEDVRRAISGIEVNEIFDGQGEQKSVIGLAKKVKLSDKIRANELLGRHLRLFTELHELSGPNGKPIETLNKSELTDEQLEAKIQKLMPITGKEEE